MNNENVSAEEARGLLEKATPGPWEARFHEDHCMIAWARGWVLDYDRPPEIEAADTRLAAAAPDLARTVIALYATLHAERAASGVVMERLGEVVQERDLLSADYLDLRRAYDALRQQG